MNGLRRCMLAVVATLVLVAPAAAQKGVGEPTGVARQADKPAIEALSGTVTEVKVGVCEQRGGQRPIGAHLIVTTAADRQVNLHLGPLRAVEHILEQTPEGTAVAVEAFRTDAMPADAYVAKSITVDDKVIHLRDANLRPSWAAGPGDAGGRGGGMGPGGGQGRGPGAGQGRGPGGGGPCWW